MPSASSHVTGQFVPWHGGGYECAANIYLLVNYACLAWLTTQRHVSLFTS